MVGPLVRPELRAWTARRSEALVAAAILLAGLWLAHAPWPADGYAGDRFFVVAAGLVAVSCVLVPVTAPAARRAGVSTTT